MKVVRTFGAEPVKKTTLYDIYRDIALNVSRRQREILGHDL